MSLQIPSKGVDQLSLSERVVLDEILMLARVEGVVTGVLIGAEAWDVRPLVLDQGRLSVIRLLAPIRTSESAALETLIQTLTDIFSKHLPPLFQPQVGYQAGKVWFSRPFVKETLVDIISPLELASPVLSVMGVRPLLALLADLFKAGYAHGNLSLSNLTLDHLTQDHLTQDHLTQGHGQLIPLDLCLHNLPAGGRSQVDLEALQKIFELLRFEGGSPAQIAGILAIGSSTRSPLERIEELLTLIPSNDGLNSKQKSERQLGTQLIESPNVVARGKLIKDSNVLVSKPYERASTLFQNKKSPQIKTASRSDSFSFQNFLNSKFWKKRRHLLWLGILIGFFGIALVISGGFGLFQNYSGQNEYIKLWNSQSKQSQLTVIEAALLDPFTGAIDVIRASALAGKSPPQARGEMIKVAFDERWYSRLSASDRKTVLSIALGALIPADLKEIAPFQTLSPGVLLALAGSVSLDNPGVMFADIPLEKFDALPEPFASGFKVLRQRGVSSLQSIQARAYAHLILGEANLNSFGNYFIPSADPEGVRLQLKVLLPFFEQHPAMAAAFEEYITASGQPFQNTFNWFVADQTAQWVKAEPAQRVSIIAGVSPQKPVVLEQLIDLLQFPQREIREQAAKYLVKNNLSVDYNALLLVLASDENRLTRAQGIFLVSALQVPDDEAFAFLSRWFSGEPDPDTVFLLLLARSRIAKSAPFDIEGARYLIDRQWQAVTEELAELVRHPEPLARALAYSRLDPKRSADLKILKAQLSADSSEKMRNLIKEKLQSAATSTLPNKFFT